MKSDEDRSEIMKLLDDLKTEKTISLISILEPSHSHHSEDEKRLHKLEMQFKIMRQEVKELRRIIKAKKKKHPNCCQIMCYGCAFCCCIKKIFPVANAFTFQKFYFYPKYFLMPTLQPIAHKINKKIKAKPIEDSDSSFEIYQNK